MLDIVYRKARRCALVAFRRTGGGAGVISEGRAKFWLESEGCSAESAWFILSVGGRVGKLVAISHATQRCNCPDHSALPISTGLFAIFVGMGAAASFTPR